MAAPLQKWVALPNGWIEQGGLKRLRWTTEVGSPSDNTAALMALLGIAHQTDRKTRVATTTYTALCAATSLSRAKLSAGLDVLERLAIVSRKPEGRSTYRLEAEEGASWAMLPARPLYDAQGRIAAFTDFKLRNQTELNALKLYFLFASRRDIKSNMAPLSYDKIMLYSGLERLRIKDALSMLSALHLVYVEQMPSTVYEPGASNAYRLVGLHPRMNMATMGRGLDPARLGFEG